MADADSQLAHLSNTRAADFVISDDSDLIMYGGKRSVFRLQLSDGTCKLLNDPVTSWMKVKGQHLVKIENESGRNSIDDLLKVGILAGCDFAESPKGVGLKTSLKLLDSHKSVEKVVAFLNQYHPGSVSHTYLETFEKAFLAYKYARVWCPLKRTVLHLRDIDEVMGGREAGDNLAGKTIRDNLIEFTTYSEIARERNMLLKYEWSELFGHEIEESIVQEIAEGKLDPVTHLPYDRSKFSCFRNGAKSKSKEELGENTGSNTIGGIEGCNIVRICQEKFNLCSKIAAGNKSLKLVKSFQEENVSAWSRPIDQAIVDLKAQGLAKAFKTRPSKAELKRSLLGIGENMNQ